MSSDLIHFIIYAVLGIVICGICIYANRIHREYLLYCWLCAYLRTCMEWNPDLKKRRGMERGFSSVMTGKGGVM
jgi:hypothetical protein